MKLLIILLALPFVGLGQDTLPMLSIMDRRSPMKLNVPKFQFIDTINGTVEYLVKVDSNKYESIKAKGYKIDSVFETYVDKSTERNTNGHMALYIDLVETRTNFRIIANGREINRYKYYTFIPESKMQKK